MINNTFRKIISHTERRSTSIVECAIIAPLTKTQEDALDNGEEIILTVNTTTFKVSPHTCYCYGEIDFNDISDDLDVIASLKLFSNDMDCGVIIPANYDYTTHTAKSPDKYIRQYDTTNVADILQYYHACIGKPKRTIVFRHKWKR